MTRYFGRLGIFIYVIFAAALFVFEEFLIAKLTYEEMQKVDKIKHLWAEKYCGEKNPTKFAQLTDEEKNTLEEYYSYIYRDNDRRMMIMAREASVQLTLQNALVIYEFFYPPLLELDFTHSSIFSIFKGNRASGWWIAGRIFQIVSIGLSVKSTFFPISDNTTLSGFRNNNIMGLINYTSQMLQVVLHLIFATGVVYLLRSTNIYDIIL